MLLGTHLGGGHVDGAPPSPAFPPPPPIPRFGGVFRPSLQTRSMAEGAGGQRGWGGWGAPGTSRLEEKVKVLLWGLKGPFWRVPPSKTLLYFKRGPIPHPRGLRVCPPPNPRRWVPLGHLPFPRAPSLPPCPLPSRRARVHLQNTLRRRIPWQLLRGDLPENEGAQRRPTGLPGVGKAGVRWGVGRRPPRMVPLRGPDALSWQKSSGG